MVHPGHPSRGCSTCRARRIKCDETRPRCGPCTKSNRTCLGYNLLSSDRKRTRNDVHTSDLRVQTRQSTITDFGCVLVENPVYGAGGAGQIEAYFGWNFILTPSGPPHNASLGFLDGLDRVLAIHGPYSMLQNMVDVFAISHRSLGEAVQTIRQRKQQLARYQQAIRDVKHSISIAERIRTSIVSVFLLALFEMLVNSCSSDKTWQTHLNGLIILSRQRPSLQTIHAMAENSSHTLLLLGGLQARFHHVSREIDKIFDQPSKPRKLDVQKLRTIVKKIFKELILASLVASKEQSWHRATSSSSAQNNYPTSPDEVYLAYSWNKLQAMVIASATFLLESGEYLHVGNTWRATDEFRKLTKITQEAVTSTYNSAAKFFGEDFPQSVPLLANGPCFFRTIEGLLWLWPLYVAYKSPGTSHIKHQWLQNTLVGIGQIGHIPKATSLAQNEYQRLNYFEFSAAITMLDFGFIVTHPCLDLEDDEGSSL